MPVFYDTVRGGAIREARDSSGLGIISRQVTKGFTATQIPGGTSPSALMSVLTAMGLPAIGSSVNDPAFGALTLEERNVTTLNESNFAAQGELVYRNIVSQGGGGSPVWSVNRTSNVTQIPTFSTAGNGKALQVFYKPGNAGTGNPPPAGAVGKSFRYNKYVRSGSITATTAMLAADWFAFRDAVAAARCTINSTPWAGYTRGQILFVGDSAKTTDVGRTYYLELQFLERTDQGFFAFGAWYNDHGGHPTDCDFEGALGGLPAVGDIIARNGITLASVQGESDFGSLFSFGSYIG